MNSPTDSGVATASLADVAGTLRRRWIWLVVPTLLGIAAGVLVQSRLPEPTPVATALVEVRPTGMDLSSSSSRLEEALDVERAVARATSASVLEQAIATTGLQLSARELAEATTVEQQGEAPVLVVSVELDGAEAAVTAAGAVADAYLAEATDSARALRDDRIGQLEAERDQVLREISALGGRIGATEDPSEAGALEGQQDAALRRVDEIEQALVDVRAQNVDPGRVLRPARLEDQDAPLGQVVAVPALAALGLLLGIAAAFVVDRVDRRIWEVEDVGAATGTDAVVRVTRDDLSGDGLRTGAGHRRLRALVAPAQFTSGSVLVTGASADHGAGIAAGLAVAVAASGRRTVLLDASGADAFDLPPGDLDGWLRGRTGLERAAQSPHGVSSLQVLTGTPDVELSSSATLRELLASPHAVVVVHAPGGSESGDALALAELVDHRVVVAAARRDRDEVVARTHRWLTRAASDEPVVVLAG